MRESSEIFIAQIKITPVFALWKVKFAPLCKL